MLIFPVITLISSRNQVVVLQVHVVLRGILKPLELFIGQGAYLACRTAHIEIAALQGFAFRHQAARSEQHAVLHYRTIQDDRADADQAFVTDGAPMDDDAVADGDIIADGHHIALRASRIRVCDMDDAAVLDIAARPDADMIDVTADHRHRPYRRLGSDHHIADDRCLGIHIGRVIDMGPGGFEGAQFQGDLP